MTASRFFVVLAVVLGLFVFFFWRMQPETRIDQVIFDAPDSRRLEGGPRHRPATD